MLGESRPSLTEVGHPPAVRQPLRRPAEPNVRFVHAALPSLSLLALVVYGLMVTGLVSLRPPTGRMRALGS